MDLLKNDYGIENKNKLLLKEREIHDKLVAEKNNEISTLNQKITYNSLTHLVSFSNFNRPLGLKRIKISDSISLKDSKRNWEENESSVSQLTRRRWEQKSEELKGKIKNAEISYEAREKVMNLCDDYTRTVSKAKYKAKKNRENAQNTNS